MNRTEPQHFEQRAMEPVAQVLIRKLLVPKIYFDARWPAAGDHEVDVLAIDRSGTGDVHVVGIKSSWTHALSQKNADRLIQIPAHYLWMAFPKPSRDIDYTTAPIYLADGPGRIGVIEVVHMPGDTLGASIALPSERFHVQLGEQVREFAATMHPDISFR